MKKNIIIIGIVFGLVIVTGMPSIPIIQGEETEEEPYRLGDIEMSIVYGSCGAYIQNVPPEGTVWRPDKEWKCTRDINFGDVASDTKITDGFWFVKARLGDIEFYEDWGDFSYIGNNAPEPIDDYVIKIVPRKGNVELLVECWIEGKFWWQDIEGEWHEDGDDNAHVKKQWRIRVTTSKGVIEGTQITNSSQNTKLIEDVRVGDFIQSYNSRTQQIVSAEVVNILECTGEDLSEHYLVFNNNLQVDYECSLYINGTYGTEWISAGDASIGSNTILAYSPISGLYWDTIISIGEAETNPNDKFYVLGINPNDGEASGYWADGILVDGYD